MRKYPTHTLKYIHASTDTVPGANNCSTLQLTTTYCQICTLPNIYAQYQFALQMTGSLREYVPMYRLPMQNCNTLQRTATHCNAMQHTAMHCSTKTQHLMPMRLASGKLVERVRNDLHMRRPRHTATRCNTLQQLSLTATPYNKLQRTSTHCNTLQHTATHRNTLQYTLTHCSTQTPHLTPTHCNALQHTATHYTILLHTATHKHST